MNILPTPALGINGLKRIAYASKNKQAMTSNACFGHKWIETHTLLSKNHMN